MTTDTAENAAFGVNKLFLGDNLDVLKTLPDACVDLVYLDPPFFSNRNYEVIWGDSGEIRSFKDRWAGGIDHYIAWLKERVEQMHRVLKPTGSLFLHCDWHANAYIRVLILDKVFGEDNFMGEIIWQRHNAHNDAKKKLAVLSDTIWYYSKSKTFTYKPIYLSFDENNHFNLEDEYGKYFLGDLTAPNTRRGESGAEWRGINPTDKGRSWAVPNIIVEKLAGHDAIERLTVQEKLDLLLENGYIVFSKKGIPSVKRYESMSKGRLVGNLWLDIQNIFNSNEKIGYPTQKPEALMERIIKMTSKEGDIVLDPFVGGGTTVAVADTHRRRWIGIDQSPAAVKVTELRLQRQPNLFSPPFTVHLHKYDEDALLNKDPFEFEAWIIQQFGGVPQNKKGADKGVDGKAADGAPIQVKQSKGIGVNVIKNFSVSAKQHDRALFEKNQKAKKPVGSIIAFSFGKGAIGEAARLKNEENIIIELKRVDEIVDVAVKPAVSVNISELDRDAKGNRKIEFAARGESGAGLEFYSWDFEYDEERGFKASVIMDKEGRQVISLKPGAHNVAVKVVDNDGLENIEVVRLRINGGVERE